LRAIAAFWLLHGLLSAQGPAASLSGSLLDEMGGPVIAARLSAKAADGHLYLARSNEQGGFRVLRMEPGTYTLSVEQNGLCAVEKSGIVLKAGEQKELGRIVMTAGDVCP
jgi:hypothetical protein